MLTYTGMKKPINACSLYQEFISSQSLISCLACLIIRQFEQEYPEHRNWNTYTNQDVVNVFLFTTKLLIGNNHLSNGDGALSQPQIIIHLQIHTQAQNNCYMTLIGHMRMHCRVPPIMGLILSVHDPLLQFQASYNYSHSFCSQEFA